MLIIQSILDCFFLSLNEMLSFSCNSNHKKIHSSNKQQTNEQTTNVHGKLFEKRFILGDVLPRFYVMLLICTLDWSKSSTFGESRGCTVHGAPNGSNPV